MALLSSKTLIKAHALCLFIIAVYLMRSPEFITDSDIVFMLGEVLRIDAAPSPSRPQSSFAACGILLIAEALVDLILVTKVPPLNEVVEMAEAARQHSSIPVAGAMRTNPFLTRLATMYSEIWTLLSASRFCLFFAVSFFIYQSKQVALGVGMGTTPAVGYGTAPEAVSGLDHLKSRVIFTYGFMEMMFWLWIYLTVRDERQEIAARIVDGDRQVQ
ncbi:hypothetical protein P168DRAFT_317512 [Aspergillus campestris IBT 28561]|uniref:Increased loss of mitochondrial DNA protein 1 n=1 Tax=Aspergillus campestris (strain IBT 28561) TaxID=1392248 RepID=A0A2I1D803_ASPC2|nr:uncharacterized protein P168DRAFT_317512 [Aspergillus campestris IBT 28561]PKY06011.1 hypothetical protein P168DRAFT_317512 [Aspergillus campestris IBT 28561]